MVQHIVAPSQCNPTWNEEHTGGEQVSEGVFRYKIVSVHLSV